MIVGDKASDDCQFLVSTAADRPEILIWKLQMNPQASQTANLKVHIQIKTSFSEGIKYVV